MEEFNENGMAIIKVLTDGVVEDYDLGNLQDIFGRCLEDKASFDRIESVFDSIWRDGTVFGFDDLKDMVED